MFKKKQQIILCVPDLHIPYEHPDALKFLKAVKKKYNPTEIVFLGDEVDYHAISFHDSVPDLPSAGEELKRAILHLQDYYKLFPKAKLLESNHGSLVLRKAINAGLPSKVIRHYNEILEAPRQWSWHFDITLDSPTGRVYFHHGKSSVPGKLSQNMAVSSVQGHYHSKFYIHYWSSPTGLYFDMNVGSLVNKKSLAMAYAKNSLARPVSGCAVIINGIPRLIPMILNDRGRWNGKL